MAFLRQMMRLMLGERGPADMAVTRSADSVHFRLSTQRCGWRAYMLIVAAAFLGSIVLALLFGTALLATIAIVQYFAWRFTWHYELTLNAKRLSVDCVSSWARRNHGVISLAHIGQFTVIRHARAVVECEKTRMNGDPLWLRLVTKAGEREDLLGAVADRGIEDYRPRAELEWVAATLQRALAAQSIPAAMQGTATARTWCAEQIQDRSGYRRRG